MSRKVGPGHPRLFGRCRHEATHDSWKFALCTKACLSRFKVNVLGGRRHTHAHHTISEVKRERGARESVIETEMDRETRWKGDDPEQK